MTKLNNYEARTHLVRAMVVENPTTLEEIAEFVGGENVRVTPRGWQVNTATGGWAELHAGSVLSVRPDTRAVEVAEPAEFDRKYTLVDAIDERDVHQIAMYQQRLDAAQNGSITPEGVVVPSWEDVGPIAREEYIADAERSLRLAMALGYRKQVK